LRRENNRVYSQAIGLLCVSRRQNPSAIMIVFIAAIGASCAAKTIAFIPKRSACFAFRADKILTQSQSFANLSAPIITRDWRLLRRETDHTLRHLARLYV
jgi:hypothetical protein